MEGSTFVFWNWTVVVYLFLAGVSAGAFAVSALAYLLDREKYQDIIRIGAYIAPFPLILGVLCLIYDLERPSLFWKLMVTLQVESVMSYGAFTIARPEGINFSFCFYNLPDMHQSIQLFFEKTFNKEAAELLLEVGIIKQIPNVDDLYDASFIK